MGGSLTAHRRACCTFLKGIQREDGTAIPCRFDYEVRAFTNPGNGEAEYVAAICPQRQLRVVTGLDQLPTHGEHRSGTACHFARGDAGIAADQLGADALC
jgi:hypothetical protein